MQEIGQEGKHKRDTGVATLWFSCNYGAILTTYALYRLLEGMGKSPVLLNYLPLWWAGFSHEPDNISVRFMKRHGIRCTEPLETDADFNRLNDNLDTFIIGSDQVWRWLFTKQYGYAYFLDFARGEKRKVAFASSFGIDRDERPAESVAKVRWYLRAFDALSVRERSGVDILRETYGLEGECVLDPVFLCQRGEYDKLTDGEPQPEEPYILSYVLDQNSGVCRCIAMLAKERGLRVVNMADAQSNAWKRESRFECGEVAADVSPEQWLNYIRHCEFFVTDSFHGVCYAIMYNRPFVCVAPPERGLTRFESILSTVGLTRCLLPPDCGETEWREALRSIAWEEVNTVLARERNRSIKWLHEALSAPRSPGREELGSLLHSCLYAGSGARVRHPEMEERLNCYLDRHTRELSSRARVITRMFEILVRLMPHSVAVKFVQKAEQERAFAHYLSIKNSAGSHGK